ncbi:protein of unknown function DUF422 [Kipferlia bialata]|uniref:Carotenoid biosynthesis protein n=1 Tax=Kipferlia bialata TaxID=797122 RepID=A0A9K3CW76_9EUKA|nr:protein of unknown function DUF422 [Kipferlia bialata]GIQ84444.1 protein of unknown function DUF422 [Kipferlia bialata]|eukprot:g1213.t1
MAPISPRCMNWLLWLLPIVFVVFIVFNNLYDLVPLGLTGVTHVILLVTFSIVHGLKRYSMRQFLVFAAITFVISNVLENLSVITSFPFGHYHYSDILGLKLFLVPLAISPAYFGAGYLAWTMAPILLGVFNAERTPFDILAQPLIAAFVMVMWDMTFDPMMATLEGQWVWEEGGCYFGVPFSNFMGWWLCVALIYVSFSLYLCRKGSNPSTPTKLGKSYWLQAVCMWSALGLSNGALIKNSEGFVTSPDGQTWLVSSVMQSLVLVSVFTMWFVALLSVVIILRPSRECDKECDRTKQE